MSLSGRFLKQDENKMAYRKISIKEYLLQFLVTIIQIYIVAVKLQKAGVNG